MIRLTFTFLILLTQSLPALANVQFTSGQQASSPAVGVEFIIPEGYNGYYEPEIGGLILQNGGQTLAVMGVSQGDVETVGHIVSDLIAELGIELIPQAVNRVSQNRLEASFSAWVEGQLKTLVGTVIQGNAGNTMAFVGMGANGQEVQLQQTISSLINDIKWGQPQANAASQQLRGLALYRTGGSSDGRSGVGGFTAVSETKEQIDFCSNGMYRYASQSQSFFSVEGASMPSSSQDNHQGNWWVVADLGGNTHVYLESSNGNYYLWPIYEAGDGAKMNEKQYSAARSQLCY